MICAIQLLAITKNCKALSVGAFRRYAGDCQQYVGNAVQVMAARHFGAQRTITRHKAAADATRSTPKVL